VLANWPSSTALTFLTIITKSFCSLDTSKEKIKKTLLFPGKEEKKKNNQEKFVLLLQLATP